MILKPLIQEYVLPYTLGNQVLIKTLLLRCQACQAGYSVGRIWGKETKGPVRFVGRTSCEACGHVAHLVIRAEAEGDTTVKQVSPWLYVLGLVLLRSSLPGKQRSLQDELVHRSLESLGRYLGEEIPAKIRLQDQLWHFVGIDPAGSFCPAVDEVVIAPGLIYRKSQRWRA